MSDTNIQSILVAGAGLLIGSAVAALAANQNTEEETETKEENAQVESDGPKQKEEKDVKDKRL